MSTAGAASREMPIIHRIFRRQFSEIRWLVQKVPSTESRVGAVADHLGFLLDGPVAGTGTPADRAVVLHRVRTARRAPARLGTHRAGDRHPRAFGMTLDRFVELCMAYRPR